MRSLRPHGLLGAWAASILLLPPVGAWLSATPLADYLGFPLTQRAWDPLPYDPALYWSAVCGLALLVICVGWLALGPRPSGRFPAWGWMGWACVFLAVPLVLSGLVLESYVPLLVGLTLALNADLVRRRGQALMTARPAYFLALFAGGMLLGWLFHWLNLFLQSWTYPGLAGVGAIRVFLVHSLQYALLLPLMLSLRLWLASHSRLLARLTHGRPIPSLPARVLDAVLLGLALLGLAGAGVWPEHIYLLTWTSPLLLGVGLQRLAGQATPFSGILRGDWSRTALTAIAALLLGTLIQAWNSAFGPVHSSTLSLLEGPSLLGLPLPAYAALPFLGLTGLWVSDQLNAPWRRRRQLRFPDFPVRISLKRP